MDPSTSNSKSDTAGNASVLHTNNTNNVQVLLPTAQINVVTANGKFIRARALLDSGSQTSFIITKLFQQTGLRTYNQNIQVLGLSSNPIQVTNMVDIKIQSRITDFTAKLSCAILDSITADLPHYPVNTNKFTIPDYIALADPEYHTPTQVDILIGGDLLFEIMSSRSKQLGNNLPFLQDTKLGYITGKAPTSYSHQVRALCSTSTRDVDEIISRFWKLEEVTSNTNSIRFRNPKERLCEKLFVENTSLSNGHFTVCLPFIDDTACSLLGGSFNMALRRFYSLERRLLKDEKLQLEYKKFIHEYISLGHAKYSNLDLSIFKNDNTDGYFLPHHPVIRESSLTTKLRVVFDASLKTTSGYSLNDILLTGPTVQPELFDILCRFRTHKYVITADIEKMYRGIRVADQDTNLQRILWRDIPNDPLQCITLVTVTYGTSAAPFLATRSLVKLADDYATDYPLAGNALRRDTYVDDILSGSDTLVGLAELKAQLNELLSLASFKLHKWVSNQKSVLCDTITSSTDKVDIHLTDNDLSVKTLGFGYNPTTDMFQFSSPIDQPVTNCTKRNILSFIGKMFDPLGILGPVITRGKLLLQQIWSRNLNWDDPLPPDILKQWQEFEKGIIHMTAISVPRWLFLSDSIIAIEIHAFSDASEKAYGTCIYLRVLYSTRAVSTRLICAKSKVAPLKPITLPRLELCSFLLMARLTRRIINILNLKPSKVHLWFDSSIVLNWINSPPGRWNTFVANIVSEIQELTNGFQRSHVKTKDNPSDVLSRGTDPNSLITNEIWWNGPSWLCKYDYSFPNSGTVEIELPEQRKTSVHTVIKVDQDFNTSQSSNSLLLSVQSQC
ncbi:uncharacterized protein LOC111692343 [Anoplophora glabripennis]|uniref:uncharacterized protein LOC111692343 n=1 Tax=Anoplophora glabripennis TaxID=217634 RepID=UPI000C76B8A6|nr:uncharacterized protein LOC111692343 [Anoplophora glabripennis]